MPSTIMEGINVMPRAFRADQFTQASTRAHRQAKKEDMMSIYSSYACIIIMPRATALQILVGNYNTETLESVYGEVQSINCLVFALQRNRSKITPILIAEGSQDNQRNTDVPAEHSTAPRTSVTRVGAITNLDDFKSLLVNTINREPVVAATEVMKAVESPHLLTAFVIKALDVIKNSPYNIVPSMREELDFLAESLKISSDVNWEAPIAFLIERTPFASSYGDACLDAAGGYIFNWLKKMVAFQIPI